MKDIKEKYDIIIKITQTDRNTYEIQNPWIRADLMGNFEFFDLISSVSVLEFEPDENVLYLRGCENENNDVRVNANKHDLDNWLKDFNEYKDKCKEKILIIKY